EKHEQRGDLAEKHGDVDEAPEPIRKHFVDAAEDALEKRRRVTGAIGDERQAPSTEEKYNDERTSDDHRGVFAEEEQREFHRAVFGVIAGDELGLRLGQVERQAVRLGENRDGENDEADPEWDEQQPALQAEP